MIDLIPIGKTLKQLEENEQFKKDVQQDLRNFVTDKRIPLEARFPVWVKHCEKVNHPWVIHEKDFGQLGRYVDEKGPDGYLDKGANYDWQYFLENLGDEIGFCQEEGYDVSLEEHYYLSVDDLKEDLIQRNFGSFTYDW